MNLQHQEHRPFKTWSTTEIQTWKELAQRQLIHGENKLSQIFFTGIKQLDISGDDFPDLTQVHALLKAKTNWELVSTNLEFADGQSWFKLLQQNKFLVTEYIRPLESLDYTPKPDVFHDLFGHVPFLISPQMSRIIRKFTQLILRSSGKERQELGHLWWYTIEFGLVRERGELRAFGAGLASSFGELKRVFDGSTALKEFSVPTVSRTKESPTAFHQTLFVLDSLHALERILDTWSESGANAVQ